MMTSWIKRQLYLHRELPLEEHIITSQKDKNQFEVRTKHIHYIVASRKHNNDTIIEASVMMSPPNIRRPLEIERIIVPDGALHREAIRIIRKHYRDVINANWKEIRANG